MKQTNNVQCKSTKLIDIFCEFLVGKNKFSPYYLLWIIYLCALQDEKTSQLTF